MIMVNSCAVSSCNNNSSNSPNLTFFSLPKDSYVRDEWLELLNMKRSDLYQHIKVCEIHFRAKDFGINRKQLKTHAIPVLKLGLEKTDPIDSDDDFLPYTSGSDDDVVIVKKSEETVSKRNHRLELNLCNDLKHADDESETGKRPSRRAARAAVKKIHNVVRNFRYTDDAEEDEDDRETAFKATPFTRPPSIHFRGYNSIKTYSEHRRRPSEDIDLIMECDEEVLSQAQTDAFLKSQAEYDMVMRHIKALKASNARIIYSDTTEATDTNSSILLSSINVVGNLSSSPFISALSNVITVTPITLNDNSPSLPVHVSPIQVAPNVIHSEMLL